MPKASEVAKKLREIADCLDADPDAILKKPYLSFGCYQKIEFLNAVKLMPRPMQKKVRDWHGGEPELEVSHDSAAIHVYATAPQKLTCKLVKPAQSAVYDCEPLLSQVEEAEFTNV